MKVGSLKSTYKTTIDIIEYKYSLINKCDYTITILYYSKLSLHYSEYTLHYSE